MGVDLECVLGLCVHRWGCCGQLKRAFSDDTAPKSIPLIQIKEPYMSIERLIIQKGFALQLLHTFCGASSNIYESTFARPRQKWLRTKMFWSVPVAMIVLVAFAGRRSKTHPDQNALWVWRY